MSLIETISSPLPRAEVIKTIERQHPQRIPIIQAKWWSEGMVKQYGKRLDVFDRYPEDAVFLWIIPVDYQGMGLSWDLDTSRAYDANYVIDDWGKLDEFIAKLPDPETDPQFESLRAMAEQAHNQDRYLIFGWWRLFFERPWQIRGMKNLLMDYYLFPQQVHRLHEALCQLYLGYLQRAIREFRPDGFWTSDDLGHQRQLFMRPDMFREFLKPYYARIGEFLGQHAIHWWLHSCGNNTSILGDLAEVGVNVFHPVQKGTMDEVAVAHEFGDRLTFLAGFDVQHALQEKDPEGVRVEVRYLMDIFDRPDGGMCIGAGNAIVEGTPLGNIQAFLDEALRYGLLHRKIK